MMHELLQVAEEHGGQEAKSLIEKARNAGIPWTSILAIIWTTVGPQMIDALKALIDGWIKNPPKPSAQP